MIILLQRKNRMCTPNTRTRSGRTIKKPERWEPEEEVVDDFGADEYDSDDGSDVSSTLSLSDDEEDEEDEDLDGFIVEDEEVEYCEEDDDESEYCESDED